MQTRSVLFSIAIALAGADLASAGSLPDTSYSLGPQDKLRIKVYDWRTGAGEMHEWPALTGEFVVGASGEVSLPLVGEIPAARGTTTALAASLSERLQKKIGLAQPPDVSVEVLTYRPFFIMGQVDKPGQYDYRPGMTVLQAVSTAGGFTKLTDTNLLGFERDALVERGELRVLATERTQLQARQARIDAVLAGASTISFPDELTSRRTDPDVDRALREESLLFSGSRDALHSQTELFSQARMLTQREVETLAAKDASLGHQFDLTKKELDQVATLVSKGLAVVPRQLALEQSASQFESNRLDVQLASLRARQEIARIDRDVIDLQNRQHSAALNEASEVRARLAAIAERVQTAQSLIYQSEVRAPQMTRTDGRRTRQPPDYSVTRQIDGISKTQVMDEGDVIRPGDTIRVEPAQDRSVAGIK